MKKYLISFALLLMIAAIIIILANANLVAAFKVFPVRDFICFTLGGFVMWLINLFHSLTAKRKQKKNKHV